MSPRPVPPVSRHRHGVALVIVLAFVLLLTGLIVAFFSRTLSERQISNGSANAAKVDMFAENALTTVLGDLRQEIAAGSTQTSPATGIYLFAPQTPAAAAPCLAGIVAADNLPNLLKRSAYQQPFFNNTGSATAYDKIAYPPSNRAANVSSVSASQNGRTVSPARWNRALLLPKQNVGSDTDFTPAGATTAAWSKAPDWIVVARDGTNPTAWSANLLATGGNPAMGRFAYNVYDEGGLLDMNVAGSPTDATVPAPQGAFPAYKKTLAFADLTQLPGIAATATDSLGRTIAGLAATRQEQVIRTLAGWRNYASAATDSTTGNPIAGSPVGGNVNPPPGYAWTSTNVRNFLSLVQSNGNGFMRTANPVLVGGQSDRRFTSRQQLIDLVLNSVADQTAGATSERANLQNALQYLGTFSRDVNQPSFAPDPNRPKIVPAAQGGNDAYSGDDSVNPSFLSMRVINAFMRFDGTTAQAGEPLVKKRFALNHLAWLTCEGPSSSRSSSDPDMQVLLAQGITRAFLDLGTDAKIKAWFGLQWDPKNHYWTYVQAGSTGSILTLAGVRDLPAAQAREPNFIELLKAGLNAGSLAKASTLVNASNTNQSFLYENGADQSVDYAVFQLAANLVDQFDADSFPTVIYFPTAPAAHAFFRGVENLPYLYRLRGMVIKAAQPVLTSGSYPYDYLHDAPASFPNKNDPLKDTGVAVALYYPEIWNPHDYKSTDPAQPVDVTSMQPRNFQVVATSDGNPFLENSLDIPYPPNSSSASMDTTTIPTVNPGFASRGFVPSGTQEKFTPDNTLMTFQVPTGTVGRALFREPTLLLRPGLPSGSNLACPGLTNLISAAGANPAEQALAQFLAPGGGIQSAVVDGALNDPLSQGYYGFFAGAAPLKWVDSGGTQIGTDVIKTPTDAPYCLVQMKCQDAFGNMVVYDEKYVSTPGEGEALTQYADCGFFNPARKNMGCNVAVDPRTNRFGMIYEVIFNGFGPMAFPPFGSDTGPVGWINRTDGTMFSQRNGTCAGAPTFTNNIDLAPYFFPATAGWTPGSPAFLSYDPTKDFRPGMMSQNNPNAANDGKRFDGDTNSTSTGPAQFYADPDGVVRRAAGAYVPTSTTAPATSMVGLPMATATASYNGSTRAASPTQADSRPLILNRPFRSVAELGYTFSGTPWRNLSFFTPESGAAALLDLFCINDSDDPAGLVAGRVDLNTRQIPVLQAVLANAYKDEWNAAGISLAGGPNSVAQAVAQALVNRTTDLITVGKGPLGNVSELVGKWAGSQTVATATAPNNVDGSLSYGGFSADLTGIFGPNGTNPDETTNNVQRFREAAIRPLASVGSARTWNLLIDLVAQTGRYPQTAASAANPLSAFSVEGETRYWLHVSIDRCTGQVVDKSLEIVKE